MKLKVNILALIALLTAPQIEAQELQTKKTWVSGYARSILLTDRLDDRGHNDTITSDILMSGHTLLDLAANIKPTDNLFIRGSLRIRNDHGGFWGSGVTFDLRNLYLRGVVGNAFRYQLGDVNYKLTEYTFFNDDEEFSKYEHKAFSWMREMNRHDLFYDQDNTWRQQGVTGEFGLSFKNIVEEVDVNLFALRLNTFSPGEFEQIYSGARLAVKQSKLLDGHINYVEAFDILGTSDATDRFSNRVLTGGIGLNHEHDNWIGRIDSELGMSHQQRNIGEDSLHLDDHFSDISATIYNTDLKLKLKVGYQNVGSGFRSIGAQTRRLNVNGRPRAFGRYGNDQDVRAIGMLDIMRDAALYNTELNRSLMDYDPSFGNFRPYGKATPNRRAITLDASWQDREEYVDLEVGLAMGSEVVGQGTTELKKFNVVNAHADFHLNNTLSWEKNIILSIGMQSEQTDLPGTETYSKVDLANMIFDIGLEVNLVDELDLVLAQRRFTSSGTDFDRTTNQVGELITFTEYRVDREENISAAALRYRFTENSMINLQWTNYNNNGQPNRLDPPEDENDPVFTNDVQPYRISDVSVIYKMYF